MAMDTGLIMESIIRDMSEGVMTVTLDGIISYVNAAAAKILDKPEEQMLGKSFAGCFSGYKENEGFNRIILDAIGSSAKSNNRVVPYFTGEETRQLHVMTSFLNDGGDNIGVIAVMSDISELEELRDAVKAMERIKGRNNRLELRNNLLHETFGRFLSDDIVRQLLATPDGLALGGKKRIVTILMSDIRGFTALSERMGATALITMLNHYLGEMTEVTSKRNGTVIDFIGDGIMAVFGAPNPSDSHAADAVAAAVEMQCRMDAINEWNAQHGYPAIEMGIGINSGEVIVGNIGSERHTKYGVVGPPVNLAARIESYTVGGQVLVSPYTVQRVKEPMEIVQRQSVFPKGVKNPIILSHVTAIGGKYNASCRQREEAPEELPVPVDVDFFVIRDKHSDLTSNPGRITGLCRTCAVMETDTKLEKYDNLQLDAGGKLFCKVVDKKGDGWLLRFTAIPAGFDGWYAEVSGR